MPLAGRPMVEWSIAAFRAVEAVRSIVVACPPGHVHELGGHDLGVVEGGETRSQSVSNALAAVGTELVAIHDAARPLLTPDLVEGVIATLAADPEADGAIAAAPVTDTIKRVGASPKRLSIYAHHGVHKCSIACSIASIVVEETLDRGWLWAAQTPQVFRTEALRAALAAWSERAESEPARVEAGMDDPVRRETPTGEPARAEAATGDPGPAEAPTDEAMLVEAAGGRVLICPAPPENLKVTTPLDLALASFLLSER